MSSKIRKIISYIPLIGVGWGFISLNNDLNSVKPCEAERLQYNIKSLQESLEQITLTSGIEIINPDSKVRIRYQSINEALRWSEQAYQKSLTMPGMNERISENHHYRKQAIYDAALFFISGFAFFGAKEYSLRKQLKSQKLSHCTKGINFSAQTF